MSGGTLFDPLLLWLPILIPAALVALVLLVTSVHFRLAAVAVGALMLLNTSNKLDLTKLTYMAAFSIAFTIALFRASRVIRKYPALLAASFVLFCLAVVSFFISLTHGTSPSNWLRDIAALLLFATAPVFALDAEASGSAPTIAAMFAILGLVAAVGFAGSYGIHDTPDAKESPVALVTLLLPAALFSYAAARALTERRNGIVWSFVGALVLVTLLLSARRSVVAVMLIPGVIAIAAGSSAIKRVFRLALFGVVGVVLMAIVIGYLSKSLGFSKQKVVARLATVMMVLNRPKSDQSFQDRAAETLSVTAAFLQYPVTGVGPGHIFKWKALAGRVRHTWAIVDTPMAIPAKFGLVGIGFLFIAIAALFAFIRALTRICGRSASVLGLIGFLAFLAGRALLGPPFDDKGMSVGLMFLLALCLIDAREKSRVLGANELPDPSRTG